MRLSGKVAIVTGAAQGIGRATVEKFVKEGASVVLADISPLGYTLAQDLSDQGADVMFIKTDVGSLDDLTTLVDVTMGQYGKIDVLVNNAAINVPGSVLDASEEDWEKTLNVNVNSMRRLCKLVIPFMQKQGGGSIINMASANSYVAEPELTPYVTSKGAILMLTKAMALDFAKDGVRINAVCPGWVLTKFNDPHTDRFGGTDEVLKSISDIHPTGKTIDPTEIANVVAFLASDESTAIIGAGLLADAGYTIK